MTKTTHSDMTSIIPTLKHSFFASLLAVLMLVPSTTAFSQDLKIGYVEPRFILERMPEMRAVQQRLQNFAERKRTELLEKEASLQQQIESYQERSSVMSQDARQKEEARLGELGTELQTAQALAEQELAQRRAELMSPLLQQVQAAIDAVAKEKKLDIVLNTTTSSGDVIILYVSDEIRQNNDITEAVLARLEL